MHSPLETHPVQELSSLSYDEQITAPAPRRSASSATVLSVRGMFSEVVGSPKFVGRVS